MLDKLNSKNKLRLLGGTILLCLLLVYFLAIKETITLASECRVKEQKLQQSKGLNEKTALLRAQIKNLDRQTGGSTDTTHKVMDLLLDHITEFCNGTGCALKEIPSAVTAIRNGYRIESCFITLGGSYKQLLDLVYLLEQKKKTGGHIASIQFYTVKNNKLKKQELLLTLYIQHYKKT